MGSRSEKLIRLRLVITIFSLGVLSGVSLVEGQAGAGDRTAIQVGSATLEGTRHTLDRDRRSYYSFQGIPYAHPPTGDKRWEEPVLADLYGNVKATSVGDRCPQWNPTANRTIGSENCLFLNVYTPIVPSQRQTQANARSLLPVMVYIHGGGYTTGSGDVVGPRKLMKQDVVLVTFNYRLGILGFLSTGDEILPGNYGLLDQIAALEWVKQNIRSFGGNPESVTIFGDSAGAASVNLLMLSPRATKTYDLARSFLLKSTYTSDLSECETPKRSRKRNVVFSPAEKPLPKGRRTAKSELESNKVSKIPLPAVPPFMTAELAVESQINSVASASGSVSGPEIEEPAFTFELLDVDSENNGTRVSEVLAAQTPVLTIPKNAVEFQNFSRGSPLSFERYMVEEMVVVKSMLAELGNKMDLIARPELTDATELEFEDDEFKTSSSVQELEIISRKSSEDKDYRKKLVRHLSAVGGTKCTKMLNLMLAELMADSVAVSYSYKGQRDKLNFESLGFASIFKACLKQNPFTQKERLHFNIEAGISAWLKRANSKILSKGLKLFHRAIMQSGSALCDWAVEPNPREFADMIAEQLECSGNSDDIRTCLKEKSPEELVKAHQSTNKIWAFPIRSAPVVDLESRGDTKAVLPDTPANLMDAGAYAQIPVIAGVNHDEGLMGYSSIHLEHGTENFKNQEYFEGTIVPQIIEHFYHAKGDSEAVTKAVLQHYFEGVNVSTSQGMKLAIAELTELVGDTAINSCNFNLLEKLASTKHAMTFSYVFTHKTPHSPSIIARNIQALRTQHVHHPLFNYGVSHSDELFYLFDPVTIYPGNLNANLNAEDQKVSDIMTKIWVGFATHGNPASAVQSLNLQPWRPVGVGNINYYNLTSVSAPMGADFRKGEAMFWLRTVPYIRELGETIDSLSCYPLLFYIFLGLFILFLIITIILAVLLYKKRTSQKVVM